MLAVVLYWIGTRGLLHYETQLLGFPQTRCRGRSRADASGETAPVLGRHDWELLCSVGTLCALPVFEENRAILHSDEIDG